MLAALPLSRTIGEDTNTLRLVYMTMIDILLHGPDGDVDLDAANRLAWEVQPYPFVERTFFPSSLIHLLGAYDGLMYGYLWAQVYGDDMFSRFATEGVTSATVGAEYRHEILEAPWTRPQLERLRRFLGREPSNRAFLARLGLAEATPVTVP